MIETTYQPTYDPKQLVAPLYDAKQLVEPIPIGADYKKLKAPIGNDSKMLVVSQ